MDATELGTRLYQPIKKYHMAQGDMEALAGTKALKDSVVLGGQIATSKNVKSIMDSLSDQGKDTTKLSDALISKWEKDKNFVTKLDEALGKDPAAAARLEKAIKADPNKVAASVNALADNQPINLAVIAPVETVATAPSLAPEAGNKKAAPTARVVETKPAAHKAAHKPAEVIAEEKARVTTAPAPQTPEQKEAGMKIARGIFEGFADQPDDKISGAIDAGMVGALATSMSQDAVSKYGVDKGVANGFAKRVNSDPNLSKAIQDNLKRNPDFVRQLAVMSKEDKAVGGSLMANGARNKMTEFMQKPELLANDAYVRNMTSSLKMANGPQGGLMGMLGGFMQSLGPMAQQLLASVQNFFAGFTGGRQIFSMSNSGGSMFPTLSINVANFNANMQQAAAFSRYSPQDMTAYAIMKDGKAFHTEVVKDSKGNPLKGEDGRVQTREVPNTMEVRDVEGKIRNVIPSVGVLMAKQEKGHYDSAGKWHEGNYQVPVVTGIDTKGNSSKLDLVTMSPADFNKYKTDMEGRSQRRFPVDAYTEDDARRAGLYPNVRQGGIMIAQVDPKSGSVGEPRMNYPQEAVTHPVRQSQVETRPLPHHPDASNDRRFDIDGTNG